MNSDLLVTFSEKKPRETAGARSANRFDYQKNWSFCELLTLHSNSKDYIMVFEHHEDVVVFNSQHKPSSAIFYQVKTKSDGNWTLNSLVKTNKDGQSILGKIYDNYLHFSDSVQSLVFSSNQGLSVKLNDGHKGESRQYIEFSQLSVKDKGVIRLAVEGDKKNYCDIIGLSKIKIYKTDLRLADHTAVTKGKLVEFFEREHPNSLVHISLVYKTIFDEIRRKTNYELPCSNSNDIIENKAITASEFENMVVVALTSRTDNELWSDASQMLIADGYKPLQIKQIRARWQKYIVDRMDVTDESLCKLRDEVKTNFQQNILAAADTELKDLLTTILKQVRLSNYFDFYTDTYIEAAILYEVVSDDSVPQVNKESKEKAE